MSKTNHFLSQDPKVLDLLDIVYKVANTDVTILIEGESGTGKELIAMLILEQSKRKNKPCISVNCGAITESLQESELFGYEKGAFTGAFEKRIGMFEAANTGTIFLDEINEMPRTLQVKFLRFLQTGEFYPIGSKNICLSDVRIIAASNESLKYLVNKKDFRKDLYYRLNIIRIEIPPLRERKKDIPLLLKHFIEVFKKQYNNPEFSLSNDLEKKLLDHDFPGNVRELENIIRRLVVLSTNNPYYFTSYLFNEEKIEILESKDDTLPFHMAKQRLIEQFEKKYLIKMLEKSKGIISRAAQQAGLSEKVIHEKLKKYDIKGTSFRLRV